MLAADGACRWSKVEKRRRRKGRRESGREGVTQELHIGAAHRSWDAVAAQRTTAAWEDLSLTTQMECERGIQMTGMSDRQRGEDM